MRTCAPSGEREAGQYSGAWIGVLRGNATEGGDDGGGPGQSSLFFLTVCHPEIGLSGARVQWPEERCTFAAFGALPTSLENPLEELVFTPGRTHNRSRSPR